MREERAKRRSMLKPYLVCLSVALLTACGGGGSNAASAVPGTNPPPPGTLSATPTQIALTAPGATQTVTASQPNYTGSFTLGIDQSSCTGVASAQQTSSASGTFTIVAGQTPGTCKMTVVGGNAQVVALTVTLTITQGAIH